MKSTIRGCISCIMPCGTLDVIRIVHGNGHVEEISGPARICAGDIMKVHPKHVLKRPAVSDPSDDHDHGLPRPMIVELPPEMELRRGKIYFLMPVASDTPATRSSRKKGKRKRRIRNQQIIEGRSSNSNFLISDHYLNEITSEKLSYQKDRRRGRVGVWRPHLESISETLHDS